GIKSELSFDSAASAAEVLPYQETLRVLTPTESSLDEPQRKTLFSTTDINEEPAILRPSESLTGPLEKIVLTKTAERLNIFTPTDLSVDLQEKVSVTAPHESLTIFTPTESQTSAQERIVPADADNHASSPEESPDEIPTPPAPTEDLSSKSERPTRGISKIAVLIFGVCSVLTASGIWYWASSGVPPTQNQALDDKQYRTMDDAMMNTHREPAAEKNATARAPQNRLRSRAQRTKGSSSNQRTSGNPRNSQRKPAPRRSLMTANDGLQPRVSGSAPNYSPTTPQENSLTGRYESTGTPAEISPSVPPSRFGNTHHGRGNPNSFGRKARKMIRNFRNEFVRIKQVFD
ncbi:MAG: hypothetical protein K2Z81_00320, partial [Cyanobacteria bacterium]|nr:hypothetical protein [Cyanobacteriota bacterium]